MHIIATLMIKDLLLLVRDKVGFFFTFFFPLVYCIFFGAIFAGQGKSTGGMKVAVVDEDQTEGSRAFIETLHEAPEVEVDVTDRQTAIDLVRRGKRVAYVVLPDGFGQRIEQPFWGGEEPLLQTGIDPSRKAEAGMLEGILMQYSYQQIQEVMSDPEAMKKMIGSAQEKLQKADDIDPMSRRALQTLLPALELFMTMLPKGNENYGGFPQVQIAQDDVKRAWRGPTNSYQVSFPQGIVWALLGSSAMFGISLVVERTRGTLVRLRMAPIHQAHILAGKAAACFVTTLGIQIVLLVLAALVFNVVPDSIPLLALALVCTSTGFVGIMMLLSVLGKTEQSAAGIGWAILLLMAMIGGGMIPVFLMPSWLKTVSHASPVKWAIVAIEGAVWRGYSFTEMLLPCGILVSIGVVCFAVGVKAFRWIQES